MFCPKCGKQNNDDAKFCMECGFDISKINLDKTEQKQKEEESITPLPDAEQSLQKNIQKK